MKTILLKKYIPLFVCYFLPFLSAKCEKDFFKIQSNPFENNFFNKKHRKLKYHLSTWMQDLSYTLNDKKLYEIAMPGSHDSGAYNFSRKSPVADLPKWFGDLRKLVKYLPGDGIVVKWSKTQSLSIAQQLEVGVRYFDLRIHQDTKNKKFYLYHGLRGPELAGELEVIRNFLNKNKGEIIVLDLSHFNNVNNEDFTSLIKEYLDNLCVKQSEKNLTYEELVKQNKRCFIFCDNKKFNNSYTYSLRKSDSHWADKVKIKELENSLLDYHGSRNHNGIWVLQYVLTPNASYIAKHLTSSLKKTTESTHKNLSSFIKKFNNLNIVMFDFVDEASCKTIVDLNLKHFE